MPWLGGVLAGRVVWWLCARTARSRPRCSRWCLVRASHAQRRLSAVSTGLVRMHICVVGWWTGGPPHMEHTVTCPVTLCIRCQACVGSRTEGNKLALVLGHWPVCVAWAGAGEVSLRYRSNCNRGGNTSTAYLNALICNGIPRFA